jgi:putative GTP pyrophosphokinase
MGSGYLLDEWKSAGPCGKKDRVMMKEEFLKNFGYTEEEFTQTGLDWSLLETIRDHFVKMRERLDPVGMAVTEVLLKNKNVHSVRMRVKEPDHLIEKLIRKKLKDPSYIVALEDYWSTITDLMGVRALHLYKEDWESIHELITGTWTTKETPVAYIREGDSTTLEEMYAAKGCRLERHEYGYRAVHYIVETNLAKDVHYVEIQVRTLFEEGWSEIDHEIRYPYDVHNPILLPYLMIFNQLAGNADSMGSYVKELKKQVEMLQMEKDKVTADFKETVEKLELNIMEKEKLRKEIERLNAKDVFGRIDPKISAKLVSGLPGFAATLKNKSVGINPSNEKAPTGSTDPDKSST